MLITYIFQNLIGQNAKEIHPHQILNITIFINYNDVLMLLLLTLSDDSFGHLSLFVRQFDIVYVAEELPKR